MKSRRRLLLERIRELIDSGDRWVDMAARLRVHTRGARGEHHPPAPRALSAAEAGHHACPAGFQCHTLPRLYGGRWDRLLRRYVTPVPPDLAVTEISVHPGQLAGLLFDEPGVIDVLFLGAPRGGKTLGLIVGAVLDSLEWPGAQGGLIAPTAPRMGILWDDALSILRPLGWLAQTRLADNELHLINGASWKFVAARAASRNLGVPLQGYTWAWARPDERQNIDDQAFAEILLRGASYGNRYRVRSSATNQNIAPFQRALEEYRTNPAKKIFPVPGRQNSFIADATWESYRTSGSWSEEDYRRIINAEIIPAEGVIYKSFDYAANVPVMAPVRRDITAELTHALEGGQGPAYPWIIGQDFGWQVNASIVLKAFADGPERAWFALDELLTRGLTAAEHAQQLISLMRRRYGAEPGQLYVIGDPHVNRPDTDESDYAQFRRAGLRTRKASGSRIDQKHRFGMVNALLCDASGHRRLYIARDSNGTPSCPRLIESLKSYAYGDGGKPEQFSKDSRRDPSHATDALGYALFPWEKLRGSYQSPKPENQRRTQWRPGMGLPVQ